MAISSASAVASHVGQARTARATYNAAVASSEADAYALADRRAQESQAVSDQKSARVREGERQLGQINAMLGDAGYSGGTADRLKVEADNAVAADLATLSRNESLSSGQIQREQTASMARAQSIVNQTPRPSILGTGLQIAGAGLNAYGSYQANTRPRGG